MEAYTLLDIGDCLWEKHDTILFTYPYYAQALSIAPDDTIIGNIYQRIGINYYHTHKYDSASFYLHKSIGYPYYGNNQSIRLLFLGVTFHKIHQTDSAKYYLEQALQYPTGLYQKNGCYTTLHKIAQQENDTAAIMYYAPLHAQYADSISKTESQLSNELHDIQTERTEKLAAQKAKRNHWLIFFIGLTCAVAWACWRAVKAYSQHKERARQAAEQAQQASVQAKELEETLEKERLRQASIEQIKESLMQKYETEEGRAMERQRLAYEERLAKAFQAAERLPRPARKIQGKPALCLRKAASLE